MKKLLIGLLAASAFTTPACASQGQPEPANAQNNATAPNQATAAATPRADADPAMWVVKDEDTTIYLFGTFHLLDGRTDWFNDEVRVAFDAAQEVVFEVPFGTEAEMVAAMQPLVMRYAIDTTGRRVSQDLTEEENRKLAAALAEIGAPAQVMDRFEPWFVSMTLTGVMAKRLGLNATSGAETVLQAAARERGLTVGGVETLDSQMQIFDGMPRAAQVTQLKEMLENLGEGQGQLGEMQRAWNSGDAAGIERMMNEGLRKDPALRRALLENRNRAWAGWIDDRLDRPGVVFMAVGAGHLVGPDSVQVFLQQRQIGSERVPQLTAGR